MDRDRIASLVKELNEILPMDGASLSIRQYGASRDDIRFIANELGFLRFGLEMMEGGLQWPTGEQTLAAAVNMYYLYAPDSPMRITTLFKMSTPDAPPPQAPEPDWSLVVAIGWLAVVVVTIGIFLVGLGSVVSWIG